MHASVENIIFWLPVLFLLLGAVAQRPVFAGFAAASAVPMVFFASETGYMNSTGAISPLTAAMFQAMAFVTLSAKEHKKTLFISLAFIYMMPVLGAGVFSAAFGSAALLALSGRTCGINALCAAAAAVMSFVYQPAAGIFLMLLYCLSFRGQNSPPAAAAGAFIAACAMPAGFYGPASYVFIVIMLAVLVHDSIVMEKFGEFISARSAASLFAIILFMRGSGSGMMIAAIALGLLGAAAFMSESSNSLTVNEAKTGEGGLKPFLAALLLVSCDAAIIAGLYACSVRSQADSLLVLAALVIYAPALINTAVVMLASSRAITRGHGTAHLRASLVSAAVLFFTVYISARI